MKKNLVKIFAVALIIAIFANSFTSKTNAAAELSDKQLALISNRCSIIKDNIKTIQHEDSRAYDHLGGYYDAILYNFITPLNLSLNKNSLPNTNLTDNQASFFTARTKFTSDYIKYQRDLEGLLLLDCETEPAKFYDKLTAAREDRAKVAKDVATLNSLISEQQRLVTILKEGL